MSEATSVTESSRPERFDPAIRRPRKKPHGRPAVYQPTFDRAEGRARRQNPGFLTELAKATDTAVALAAVSAFLAIQSAPGAVWGPGTLLLLAVIAVFWRLVFLTVGLYAEQPTRTWRQEAPTVAAATFVGVLALAPLALLLGAWAAVAVLAAYPVIVAATTLSRATFRTIASSRRNGSHRVLIVGSGPLALNLHQSLREDPASGYELVGFVDSAPHIRFGEVADRLIGSLEDLEKILMHTVVDEVFIALPVKSHYDVIQRAIGICEQAGIQASYSAEIFRPTLGELRYRPSGAQASVSVQVVADDYRLGVKRAVDILGAGLGLIVLFPLLVAIGACIKLTSKGPVFYAQERYGWRKRRFRMLKFRTMVVNADELQETLEDRNEALGPVFKIRNDPRMTPLGRLLRASSLDELPQLWNVLRGEMSLVGPRPLPIRDVGRFDQSWLMRRFSVTPGMTGLWQVSGRSDLAFGDWAALDLEYIDTWSLELDLKILFRTFPAVMSGAGAS